MDELKKDGLLPGEDEGFEAADTADEASVYGDGDEKAELIEELEGIRDMFQQELDRASALDETEDGMLIQELDSDGNDDYEDEEDDKKLELKEKLKKIFLDHCKRCEYFNECKRKEQLE